MTTEELVPWLQSWLQACQDCFQHRLLFAGLQGSHQRGEAEADSDVDLVVILDDLHVSDLKIYRDLLNTLPPVRACGFLAGQQELQHWIRSDLFQFYYDTRPLYGDIQSLQKLFTYQDIRQAIHIGACNLYHAACHSYVFDEPAPALAALYKTSFFLLQAHVFLQTGRYVSTKRALLDVLAGEDRSILQTCLEKERLPFLPAEQVDSAYQQLIAWAGALICTYGQA